MDCIWHDRLEQRLNDERSLDFSTLPGSEDDFNCAKKKVSRDPMSHRVIEKRRRDRMNNCLADLSRLIPSNYLKKGRGRIEKTEIIEMAIKHLKQLQAHKCPSTTDVMGRLDRFGGGGPPPPMPMTLKEDVEATSAPMDQREQYRLGYQECVSETMHFLVELEGLYPGDSLCIRLMNHLQKHCGRMVNGARGDHVQNQEGFGSRTMMATATTDGTLCHRTDTRSVSPRPLSPCRPPSEDESSHFLPRRTVDVAHIKVEKKDTTCPISNGHRSRSDGDDDDDDEAQHGSQLREILQNPSMLSRCVSANSSRPVSTTSSSGSSSVRSDEVYKFKRNIKERFKADQQDSIAMDNSRQHQQPVQSNLVENQTDVLRKRRRMSPEVPMTIYSATGYHSPSSSSSSSEAGNRAQPASIPIFALHPTGGYYVPMSMDASLILPYMTMFHQRTTAAAVVNTDQALLHHVAIAVYFQSGGANIRIPSILQEPISRPRNNNNNNHHVPFDTTSTAPAT